METQEILGTAEAARALGVTVHRVRALIRAQRLPARKVSRDWVIDRADLALVAERRPGRPRRQGQETGQP